MTIPLNSILSLSITTDIQIIRGSGVMLSSGLYVITVAHLFDNYDGNQLMEIRSADGVDYKMEAVYIHHGWDSLSSDYNNDIAIVKLQAQTTTAGLSLWQSEDYIGAEFTLTGFGNDTQLHIGTNTFDGDAVVFNQTHNKSIISGTQILYDYDNGLELQNSIQGYFGLPSSMLPTIDETLAKHGDSGGALLVNNQIAAISSYIFRASKYDVNDSVDSGAGEVGVATRINPYIPWIESITLGNPDYIKPEQAGDVIISIAEPFSGEIVNFFLLEMHLPSLETVTLKYVARDGTAIAGLDYKHTEGWLELLPGETSAAIAVTIYGDIEWEEDETFSLVVVDPTGQWIDNGVELIATHTIINNDLF